MKLEKLDTDLKNYKSNSIKVIGTKTNDCACRTFEQYYVDFD